MVAEGEWKRVKHRGRAVEVRKKHVSATRQGGRKSETEESVDKKCGRVVRVGQEIHHLCQEEQKGIGSQWSCAVAVGDKKELRC